ncbi:MAG: hypothetical protein KGD63_15570 [Candidatus Lokiarchaeota archaeon]|nr:hypothetical protein [Candidatus Lokiarchaeota archaeon]
MELYLVLEVISEFILATMSIIAILIIELTLKRQNKHISLLFLQLAILSFAFFNITNSLSILLVNRYFSHITGMLMFPCVLFMVIGINYSLKESYFSNILLIIIALGSLLIYLGFQLDAVYFDENNEIYRWDNAFMILAGIFNFINPLYLLYWGFRTWRNSPYHTKREAIIFFMGHIIFSFGAVVFLTLFLFEPLFIVLANITLAIGEGCMIFALIKDPRILHILPIHIFRIIVKNREGHPIYDFSWSDYNIRENVFSGFLNAVQKMSEDIMNIGSVLNITLEDGILNLNESEYITVGIVASKSSKSLRESLVNFTLDFEEEFKRLLKKSCLDINEYKSAYFLVKKHFSNYSTRFITSKKSLLYLPLEKNKAFKVIESKIRNIITDDNELKIIQEDLVKTPSSYNLEFLELYEELKDETEELNYNLLDNPDTDLQDPK